MKIAIMQPYLFPYIGYWQLMNAVDIFVNGAVDYIALSIPRPRKAECVRSLHRLQSSVPCPPAWSSTPGRFHPRTRRYRHTRFRTAGRRRYLSRLSFPSSYSTQTAALWLFARMVAEIPSMPPVENLEDLLQLPPHIKARTGLYTSVLPSVSYSTTTAASCISALIARERPSSPPRRKDGLFDIFE